MNGLHIHRVEKCFRHFPTCPTDVHCCRFIRTGQNPQKSNLKYFESSSIIEFSETGVDWWHPHKDTISHIWSLSNFEQKKKMVKLDSESHDTLQKNMPGSYFSPKSQRKKIRNYIMHKEI